MGVKCCCLCNRWFSAVGNTKTCSKTCSVEYRKQQAIARTIRWQKANRGRKNLWTRKWRQKNRFRVRLEKRMDYLKHRTKRNAQILAWLKGNTPAAVLARLKNKLRVRMLRGLNGVPKSASTMSLVGCSVAFLKQHLERQFKPGMNWDNRGLWHIDHIRPCKTFDLCVPLQQQHCFHWSNLQPLWASENIRKGAKWLAP